MGNWNQCFLWFSCYLLENMCLLVNPRFCGLGLYGGYEELCQWSYMVDILSRPAPKFFFFFQNHQFSERIPKPEAYLESFRCLQSIPAPHITFFGVTILSTVWIWCFFGVLAVVCYFICFAFFLCFALLMPGIGLYLGVEQYIYLK